MKQSYCCLVLALLIMTGCSAPAPKPAKVEQPAAATNPVVAPAPDPESLVLITPGPDEAPRPFYPRVDLVPGYVVDLQWPTQRPAMPWGPMAGVAIDSFGNIWTLSRSTLPVQVFSPEGRILQAWPNTHIKQGHQIRIDREGFVWIADYKLHTVRKFDRSGQLLLTVGIPGWAGTDNKRLNLPCDVVVAPNGDLFIADGYANNRVVHTDPEGKFIKTWGKMGVKEGEFSLPHSIAMDSKGLLYVADRNNNRIQVFDQSGKFIRSWGQMMPWTLWITPDDELYVIGCSPTRWREGEMMVGLPPKDQIIMHLTTDFELIKWWTFPFKTDVKEMKPGDVSWIHGLAVDHEGNLYIGDVTGNRIQRFWLQQPTTIQQTPTTRP